MASWKALQKRKAEKTVRSSLLELLILSVQALADLLWAVVKMGRPLDLLDEMYLLVPSLQLGGRCHFQE